MSCLYAALGGSYEENGAGSQFRSASILASASPRGADLAELACPSRSFVVGSLRRLRIARLTTTATAARRTAPNRCGAAQRPTVWAPLPAGRRCGGEPTAWGRAACLSAAQQNGLWMLPAGGGGRLLAIARRRQTRPHPAGIRPRPLPREGAALRPAARVLWVIDLRSLPCTATNQDKTALSLCAAASSCEPRLQRPAARTAGRQRKAQAEQQYERNRFFHCFSHVNLLNSRGPRTLRPRRVHRPCRKGKRKTRCRAAHKAKQLFCKPSHFRLGCARDNPINAKSFHRPAEPDCIKRFLHYDNRLQSEVQPLIRAAPKLSRHVSAVPFRIAAYRPRPDRF